MVTYLIAFLLSLLIITYSVLKLAVFNYWKRKNVPFAKPSLLFGNIRDVIFLRKTWSTFIQDMHNAYSNQPYTGIYNVFQPALIIRDLELIKNILVKDFNSFQNNWYEADPHVDPVISQTPFIMKENEWKYTRGLLTPQFTSSKIKAIFTPLEEVCTDWVQYIKSKVLETKSTCFELTDLSGRFTGESVMRCGYSLNGKSFTTKIPNSFIIAGATVGSPTKLIIFKRTLGLLFKIFGTLFKVTFYGDRIHNLFADIISVESKNRELKNISHNDYLNYLLELNKTSKIDKSQVPGFAFVLFLDGFETSFSALSYALFELSLNPDVQKKARQEVNTILAKYNGVLGYEAFKELNYIQRIVFETLRKYSVIKIMSKVCTQDYEVCDKQGNVSFFIEKGTPVFWSLSALHTNPEYYPDPNKFDPDRFTEEQKQTRPKYSFLGFGDGPRICLGRNFALAQIVMALAAILPEFDLQFNVKTPFPIVRDTFHISDVPVSGLYIDFIQRNNKCN